MEQSGEYIWRTVKDGRVRSSHAMREGMTFKWTDPPDDGHPGEAFNCRCWAEPFEPEYIQSFEQHEVDVAETGIRTVMGLEFVRHFLFGGGRALTLRETGYLEEVAAETRRVVYPRLENELAKRALEIRNGSLVHATSASYDFGGVAFVFGGGTINTRTNATVRTQERKIVISGRVTYTYYDVFTDPLSVREREFGTSSIDHPGFERQPDSEFGGTAFEITDTWYTELTGIIEIRDNR